MRKKILYVFSTVLILLLIPLAIYTRWDIPLKDLKQKYTNEYSRFIAVAGLSIHYRIEGKGMPLLLLHGTAASLHTWDAWVAELKSDYKIIRLDMPAFGLTGPHPKRDYAIEMYVRILHDFLQKLNIQEFCIAGNSLGGLIAWEYALQYPKEVKKMILIDPAGIPIKRKTPWVFTLARTPILNQIVRYVTPRFFFENNLKQVYADDRKVTRELIDRYYELGLREGNRQAFIDRSHLSTHTNHLRLSELKMPILLQWGQEDSWIPVASVAKYKKAIPHLEAITYPHCGHVPMEELPKETVKDAKVFLEKE
jgi:pimeloyl-ACP methyl ester carboxylesterase